AVGAVRADGGIVNVSAALGFASMQALIEAGPAALDKVRGLVAALKGDVPQVSAVKLLPPIPEIRRNIYAVGWNYLAHFEEAKELRQPGQELP
ncbi:hypothetical protein ACJEKX_23860, partial [Escherichia coli]